ncbi:MAG: molybdopterin molybdotransferase MoeA [Bdellovibrionales bacterium]|jgi:molybdopterin molybdotransferase|nr:molybdopterin molybdotransferase MoeA [Bdellovibrionales bacterium]MBT3524855.1 molybdopterin molybdotransferase MoeA [Bdellovibrionales bacterium]MBT7767218.1 molybdopterin molybdotransferase MoeA [Bdellovibrionales bacterium]
MLNYEQALATVLSNTAHAMSEECVALEQSLGRVLSRPIVADRPLPPFNRVAMDGLAFKHSDFNPTLPLEIKNEVLAGMEVNNSLAPNQAFHIMTGAALPASADTVVQIEHFELQSGELPQALLQSGRDYSCGLNIHPVGADAAKGEELVSASSCVTPAQMGVMAAVGSSEVWVKRKPVVNIFSTGDELVAPEDIPTAVQIRDSNSYVLMSFCQRSGANAKRLGTLKDDLSYLRQHLGQGLAGDILLLSGGVSAGTHDYIPQVLEELGVTQVFHKVAIKPGKPLWFGVSDSGVLVFGLPGNPVSTQVNFNLFVRPVIHQMVGLGLENGDEPKTLRLPISLDWVKRSPRPDQFINGKITASEQGMVVLPIHDHGSGDFCSFAKADALIRLSGDRGTTYSAGSLVEVIRM